MEEKIEKYLELYPIYKTLENDVKINVNDKINYIPLSNESLIGRNLYDQDVEYVKVIYPLNKGKYLEESINKIKEIYSIYNEVEIIVEDDISNVIQKISQSKKIIVKIPCEFNKKCYLKLDIEKKQLLRLEAANNVKSGLCLEPEQSKKI